MTDDLVKRARDAHQDSSERTYKIPLIIEMADRIEALTAERDEALNQLDSERHSIEVLEKRVAKFMADDARLRAAIDDVVCGRGMFGLSADDDLKWAMQHLGSALNAGKEVMPNGTRKVPNNDIGPGDQAVAGAVTVQAQIDAERERADKAEAALRASVGGCDANEGWSHKPISIDGGKYFFCQDCGETLTKAVANRHSTAAAIRKGDQP